MKIKDVIKNSVFASIATVKEESYSDFYGHYRHNQDFVKNFKHIVYYINVSEGCSESSVNKYITMIKSLHTNAVIKKVEKNYGHMFGTIDLEEKMLSLIKIEYPECKFVFKSMEDVLIAENFLNKEFEDASFYFLPSFSFNDVVNSKKDIFELPQTTFFIINKDLINNLYGDDILTKKDIYHKQKLTNPELKPWEMSFNDGLKFDCENHLKRTVANLKTCSLLDVDGLGSLQSFVYNNFVGDPSHKNIYFKKLGVCHYHFLEEPVYEI
jgi:hypothetical protein